MDTVKLSAPMPDGNKCPQCGTPLPIGALAGLCPACLLKMGAAADTVTDGKQLPFTPPSVAELAPLFPQLEILELIGKGGMGAVYKARQKQLDRFVALKILPPGIGTDTAFAERFAREAKALAKLNHPGIVTLFEFGSSGRESAQTKPGSDRETRIPLTSAATPIYFFLMEFVDGLNLRQLLHAGRISARETLAIVPQICDALQFAHDHGIVHRDIKPENILMDRRGRVKVADFGLAKIVGGNEPLPPSLSPSDGERVAKPGEGTSLTGEQVMGTPQYMSPEQRENPGEVDHRADIYALGVVFYQMLTGELPGKTIAPPSTKVLIDVRLDEVVLRALEKKPELRYQQVSEVKSCVETIVQTPSSDATGHPPQEPTPARPDWITWSPFQSPEVQEICAHMTDGEKVEATRRATFWGLWCAATCFPFFFSISALHGSKFWFVAAAFAAVQAVVISVWLKMQRQLLSSTTWAQQQGIKADRIRIFAFDKTRLDARGGARFSRTAIVGVCWSGLAVCVGLFVWQWGQMLAPMVNSPGGVISLPMKFQLTKVLFVVLAGSAIPGMTILGWVAVSQIRRSAGKLHGLWLAVFDGLLFPVLALDAAVFGLVFLTVKQFANNTAADNMMLVGYQIGIWLSAWIVVSTLVSVVLDWLIIRRVWRAVNKPQASSNPSSSKRESALSESEREPDDLRRHTSAAPSRKLTGPQTFLRSLAVGAFVWLLVFAVTAAVTSLLPKTYAATVRVKLPTQTSVNNFDPYLLQTELERIDSPEFFKQVAAAADLKTHWKDLLHGNQSEQSEYMAIRLRSAVHYLPVRGTAFLDIRYHSEAPGEAADIANAIASVYREQSKAEIVEKASVPTRPVRPNPFVNLAIGVVGGGLVGLIAGGITALYLKSKKTRSSGSSGRVSAQTAPRTPKQDWMTWSPLQSPEVGAICSHLTKTERNHFSVLGLLFATWIPGTIFGLPVLIRSFPAPGNWIVASVWVVLFIVSIPMLQSMVRHFLCSTEWAKANGYTPDTLRLFSFRGSNLWTAFAVLVVSLLFAFTQYAASKDVLESSLRKHQCQPQHKRKMR